MYWFHRPLAPTQLRRKHIFSAMLAAARAAARSVLVQRWSRSDRSLRKAPCSVVVDRPCRFTRSVCVCVGASEREVHYATRVLLCRFGACGRVRVCADNRPPLRVPLPVRGVIPTGRSFRTTAFNSFKPTNRGPRKPPPLCFHRAVSNPSGFDRFGHGRTSEPIKRVKSSEEKRKKLNKTCEFLV